MNKFSNDVGRFGNLNPQNEDEVHLNWDQNLSLEGGLVVYTGQRCPLGQDGSLGTLAVIAGYGKLSGCPYAEYDEFRLAKFSGRNDEFRKLKVLVYETSDRRLKWHETLDHYLVYRAPWSEVMKASVTPVSTLRPHTTFSPGRALWRFPEKERLHALLSQGLTQKAYAEFDSAAIREMRMLIHKESD